ncbi:MAG: efflux RND transporter periplasmic adaptor subunit [Candidatus Paceibacterota bacterium]|jgi:multidrug efflux pump subunit AcrA (membrane-fusion protein)
MKKLIKRPIFIISVIIVVVVAGLIIVGNLNKKPVYQISLVQKGNIIQEVSETGKIKPAESVDLTFDYGGKISQIYVSVGDRVYAGQTLMQLENSDAYAQVLQSEANLETQQDKLNEAQKNLNNAILDSYSKAIDAVRNKLDQMFIKNETVYQASLNLNFYNTGDFSIKSDIESKRLTIELGLRSWKASLDKLNSTSSLDVYASEAKTNLGLIRDLTNRFNDYFNTVDSVSSLAVNYLSAYRILVSSANAEINTAISSILSAEQTKSQQSQIQSSEANLLSAQSQLSKTILKSPIQGVVAKVNATKGEIISANDAAVTIISESKLEIETNIPEADIAKVKIGNDAKITLDAYGNDVIFNAKVAEIDLDATIIEGVPTYKTKLIFTDNDDRIISGMTANITITTMTKNDVVVIPYKAIITINGDKFVAIETSKNKTENKKVVIGLRGSDGNIEIVEGLSEGNKVAIYPTSQ